MPEPTEHETTIEPLPPRLPHTAQELDAFYEALRKTAVAEREGRKMPELRTPDDVRQEIIRNITEGKRGPDAHEEAELEAERSEAAYEAALDTALLAATGTVDERKARARLAAQAEQDTAFIARARHNKIKLKIRQLDNSTVALQSVLKSIQNEGA
jgi:hypothetical protein